jgi:hypothetical protein
MVKENIKHTSHNDYTIVLNELDSGNFEVSIEQNFYTGFVNKKYSVFKKAMETYDKITTSKKIDDKIESFLSENSNLESIIESAKIEDIDDYSFFFNVATKDGGNQKIKISYEGGTIFDFKTISAKKGFPQKDSFQTHILLNDLSSSVYDVYDIEQIAEKMKQNLAETESVTIIDVDSSDGDKMFVYCQFEKSSYKGFETIRQMLENNIVEDISLLNENNYEQVLKDLGYEISFDFKTIYDEKWSLYDEPNTLYSKSELKKDSINKEENSLDNLVKKYEQKEESENPFVLIANKIEEEKKEKLILDSFTSLLSIIKESELIRIANDYNTPNEVLKSLIYANQDLGLDVYKNITNNPNITTDDIKEMSMSKIEFQNIAVATTLPNIDDLSASEYNERRKILVDMKKPYFVSDSLVIKINNTIESMDLELEEKLSQEELNPVQKVHEVSTEEHYKDEDKKINKNRNR